jgi:hypothetical protein
MGNRIWSAAFAVACLLGGSEAHAVNAEPGDSDDRTLAKTARARAKMSSVVQSNTKRKDGGDGDRSCDLNIGNSVNTKPGAGPKEIIVVVQGDVINANNKCK